MDKRSKHIEKKHDALQIDSEEQKEQFRRDLYRKIPQDQYLSKKTLDGIQKIREEGERKIDQESATANISTRLDYSNYTNTRHQVGKMRNRLLRPIDTSKALQQLNKRQEEKNKVRLENTIQPPDTRQKIDASIQYSRRNSAGMPISPDPFAPSQPQRWDSSPNPTSTNSSNQNG